MPLKKRLSIALCCLAGVLAATLWSLHEPPKPPISILVVVMNEELTPQRFRDEFAKNFLQALGDYRELGIGVRWEFMILLPESEESEILLEGHDLVTGKGILAAGLPVTAIHHPDIAGRLAAKIIRSAIRVQMEANPKPAPADKKTKPTIKVSAPPRWRFGSRPPPRTFARRLLFDNF